MAGEDTQDRAEVLGDARAARCGSSVPVIGSLEEKLDNQTSSGKQNLAPAPYSPCQEEPCKEGASPRAPDTGLGAQP